MKPVLSDHSKIGRISAVINQIAFFKCVDFVEAKSSLKFAFKLYLVANLTENVHHKNLCDYLSRLYTIEERLQRGGGCLLAWLLVNCICMPICISSINKETTFQRVPFVHHASCFLSWFVINICIYCRRRINYVKRQKYILCLLL